MSQRDRDHERLSDLRRDALLDQLQVRMDAVHGARDRLHGLLEAVLSVGREFDLSQVLRNIVEAATVLVDAEHGTLRMIGEDDLRSEFMGELIRHPEPPRLTELSEHHASHGFSPRHPPMRSFLGAPIRVRGKAFGNIYLTGKHGAPEFDADDEAVLLTLAVAAGVAIENARLYEESRRRERWLVAGTEVTNSLLSGCPRAKVMALIFEHARANVSSDAGILAVPVEGTGKLRIALAAGMDTERHQGALLPQEDGYLGVALAGPGPVESPDIAHDPRTAGATVWWAGLGPAIAVPLGSGAVTRGVLLLAREAGGAPFDDEESGPLTGFARQAALTMELAERRTDAEHLAVSEDRDRIARDLHDLAIQRLFATGMTMQSAQRFVDHPRAAERLQRAVNDLDTTIKIIRSTIFGLRAHESGAAPPQGLRYRLMHVAEESATSLGFPPAVRVEGAVESWVPGELADHATAVLTEALSNVAKHARANSVDVHLCVASNRLTLTVTDDGRGIPVAAARSGLYNVEKRARMAGGAAEVYAPSQGGTRLCWSVPLETVAAEE